MDATNSPTAAARSYRPSLEVTPQDLAAALIDKLGSKIVAFIADKNVSTVSRWATGATTPTEQNLVALRVAYQIFTMLEGDDSDHTIRAWFIGMNPQLDDDSPAEALATGRMRETLAAARAFQAGG